MSRYRALTGNLGLRRCDLHSLKHTRFGDFSAEILGLSCLVTPNARHLNLFKCGCCNLVDCERYCRAPLQIAHHVRQLLVVPVALYTHADRGLPGRHALVPLGLTRIENVYSLFVAARWLSSSVPIYRRSKGLRPCQSYLIFDRSDQWQTRPQPVHFTLEHPRPRSAPRFNLEIHEAKYVRMKWGQECARSGPGGEALSFKRPKEMRRRRE